MNQRLDVGELSPKKPHSTNRYLRPVTPGTGIQRANRTLIEIVPIHGRCREEVGMFFRNEDLQAKQLLKDRERIRVFCEELFHEREQ